MADLTDREMVAAMVAGDPRGLDAAYRRYAPRLLAYCVGLLHDGQAASDAVHDTFLLASTRAGQLREPDRLLPWLYAIARRECLRHAKAGTRFTPLPEAGEPAAEQPDPVEGLHAEQIHELVHSAIDALNSGDREVIQLALQHRLSTADVAAVLELSMNHAHARLSRARTQLERAIGVLLMLRHGRSRCVTLDELVRGWDGRFTPRLRKQVGRHVDSCRACSTRRDELTSPTALLVAYGLLPTGGIMAAIAGSRSVPAATPDTPPQAVGPGPSQATRPPSMPAVPGSPAFRESRGDGTPLRLDKATGFPRRTQRSRSPLVLIILLLVLCVAGLPVAVWQMRPEAFPSTAAPVLPSSVTFSAPAVAAPSPLPSATPEPSKVRQRTSAPATTPAQFVITIKSSGISCTGSGKAFDLHVLATAPPTMRAARLVFRTSTGNTGYVGMPKVQPSVVRGTVPNIVAGWVDWWVEGVTYDGVTGETPHTRSVNTCL